MSNIEVSIVIPVYNEQETLPQLFKALIPVVQGLGRRAEIIFTNDGSADQSGALLADCQRTYPDLVRVIDFHGNFGQHMAIMAAFEQARGTYIITLDADLQNPPVEIPNLIKKMDEGYDYVGTYRLDRQDTPFRTYISRLVNWMRELITSVQMTDHGCMLRGYHRHIVDQIVASREPSLFIPALAYRFAATPVEIPVTHAERFAGVSKYNLYRLIRLNFDLITGLSLVPLQAFTLFGMLVSILSGMLVAYMILRRLIIGPEAEGLFTLSAIIIFLVSVCITGIGIVGEYIGRIYQSISSRPRFVVRQILEGPAPKPGTKKRNA